MSSNSENDSSNPEYDLSHFYSDSPDSESPPFAVASSSSPVHSPSPPPPPLVRKRTSLPLPPASPPQIPTFPHIQAVPSPPREATTVPIKKQSLNPTKKKSVLKTKKKEIAEYQSQIESIDRRRKESLGEILPLSGPLAAERRKNWCAEKRFASGRIILLDEVDTMGWNIRQMLTKAGCVSIFEVKEFVYPYFVKDFYSSASYSKERKIIAANVKGVKIILDKFILGEILGIDNFDVEICGDDKNWFDFYEGYENILGTVFIGGKDSRLATDLRAKAKLLHALICASLLPRGVTHKKFLSLILLSFFTFSETYP